MVGGRRSFRASVGVAVALAVGAAGCTTSGPDAGKGPARPRTSGSTGPSTTTTPGRPTTTERGAPTPVADDVADATFPGLGDPRIDVATETVVVRADPGKASLSGRATLTLSPTGGDPLESFTLDLRGPKVRRTTVDGRKASVTATEAELTITPARPLRPGKTATVVIDYRGTPDQTVFPVLGAPVGWQADDAGGWFTMSEPNGTSTWVPVSDHPSDKAVWRVTLDTPEGTSGISNGELVSHRTAKGRTRWVWREREPMAPYLLLAAVGAYDLITRTTPDGTRVLVAVPPKTSATDRKGFDVLDDIIGYFAETFGGRADDDAGAIVVDKDLGLALETQTRPLFGPDSLRDGQVAALAHELGHQWFGDDVTTARWPDLWLNEGFATYADWLWSDHTKQIRIDEYAKDIAAEYADNGLTVRDPQAAKTFDNVVYERGALTLHALRKTVGDPTFFRILRTWLRTYGGRSATSDDFVRLSSRLAKRDLTAFFASWLDEVPQPKLPG